MRPQNSRCHNPTYCRKLLLEKAQREGADSPTATELKAVFNSQADLLARGSGPARSRLLLLQQLRPPQALFFPGAEGPAACPTSQAGQITLTKGSWRSLAGEDEGMNAGPQGLGLRRPSTARWSWGKLGLLRGTEERGKSRGLGVTQNCLQIPGVSPVAVWPREVSPSQPPGSHVPDEGNIYLTGCHRRKGQALGTQSELRKAHSSSQPRLP